MQWRAYCTGGNRNEEDHRTSMYAVEQSSAVRVTPEHVVMWQGVAAVCLYAN